MITLTLLLTMTTHNTQKFTEQLKHLCISLYKHAAVHSCACAMHHAYTCRCDCLASLVPFTNIQTYLLTYLAYSGPSLAAMHLVL